MLINRVWAMPNKWTFKVAPLRDIIFRYKQDGQTWMDPFAGFNSPAEITNDLNPESPAIFHEDAHDLTLIFDEPIDGAIFDPPYSLTQVSRSYSDLGLKFKGKENPTGGYPKVKDWLARIIKPEGYCISYGWNTVGLGLKRGFDPVEYLVCSHGGNRNDTLVVVEQKRAA